MQSDAVVFRYFEPRGKKSFLNEILAAGQCKTCQMEMILQMCSLVSRKPDTHTHGDVDMQVPYACMDMNKYACMNMDLYVYT